MVRSGPDCNDAVATCTSSCADGDGDSTADCADTCIDVDGDGYGSAGGAGNTCAGADCADDSASTFPGAAPLDDAQACMKDFDEDDYGDRSPPGGVAAGTDCDDTDNDIAPGSC